MHKCARSVWKCSVPFCQFKNWVWNIGHFSPSLRSMVVIWRKWRDGVSMCYNASIFYCSYSPLATFWSGISVVVCIWLRCNKMPSLLSLMSARHSAPTSRVLHWSLLHVRILGTAYVLFEKLNCKTWAGVIDRVNLKAKQEDTGLYFRCIEKGICASLHWR